LEARTVSDLFKLSRRSFLVMPLALAACKEGWSVLELAGQTMGTAYSITAVDHSNSVDKAALQAAVDQRLARVTAQMSNWEAGSEISRFNAQRTVMPFAVSPEFSRVMAAADQVHKASDGRFDVTVGPLIDAWGFGARGPAQRPDEAAIEMARAASGQARMIEVQDGALRKRDPRAEIYVSAIGKGFGVDELARAVRDFGISDFMVEIGGDLYASGLNPDGKPWQIGIESPLAHDRGVDRVIGLSGLGMATSGDYRNYFEADGQRYSHILDASTGRPVTHRTASVTVLTEDAMLADAWATAMLALGSERGLEIAQERNLAVLFLDRDGAGTDVSFTAKASARFEALTA
jgi:thiamine biosynthesis lipoprotein